MTTAKAEDTRRQECMQVLQARMAAEHAALCGPHILQHISEILPAPTLVVAAFAGVIAAAQVLLDTARAELARRHERLEDLQARMAMEPEPPPSETPPKPKQRAPGARRWDAAFNYSSPAVSSGPGSQECPKVAWLLRSWAQPSDAGLGRAEEVLRCASSAKPSFALSLSAHSRLSV